MTSVLVILFLGIAQATRPAISSAFGSGAFDAAAATPTVLRPPAATTTLSPDLPSQTRPDEPATTAARGRTTAPPTSSRGVLHTLVPVVTPLTVTSAGSVAPVAPSATSPSRPTSPGGYGCDAALAYLAANQAPGFVDICGAQSAGPGAAGKTVANFNGGVASGTIYISCPAPIVYMNEASNSWRLSGLSSTPFDPWGGVPWSQCHHGDIAPA